MLNEIAMSGQKFNDVIKNPNIKIGFEFEYLYKKIPSIGEEKIKNLPSLYDYDIDGNYTGSSGFNQLITTFDFFDNFDFNEFLNTDLLLYIEQKIAKLNPADYIQQTVDLWFERHSKDDVFNIDHNEKFIKNVYDAIEQKFLDKKFSTNAMFYCLYGFSKPDYLSYNFFDNPHIQKTAFEFLFADKTKLMQKVEKYELMPMNGWKSKIQLTFNPSKFDNYTDFDLWINYWQKMMNITINTDKSPRLGDTFWYFTEDSSLAGDGFELVSPPRPLSQSLDDMKKMLDIAKKSENIYVNYSCGFHIGVSCEDIKNIDILKLVLFLGDTYILKQFERYAPGDFLIGQDAFPGENDWNKVKDNFATASLQNLTQNARSSYDLQTLDIKDKNFIKKISSMIVRNKYHSINFEKLNNGYIEFRAPGNSMDFNVLKAAALRFSHAVSVACDPEAYKQEYNKKLYQWWTQVLHGKQDHKTIDPITTKIKEIWQDQWIWIKQDIMDVIKNPENLDQFVKKLTTLFTTKQKNKHFDYNTRKISGWFPSEQYVLDVHQKLLKMLNFLARQNIISDIDKYEKIFKDGIKRNKEVGKIW
jgi:hypothetical protein